MYIDDGRVFDNYFTSTHVPFSLHVCIKANASCAVYVGKGDRKIKA